MHHKQCSVNTSRYEGRGRSSKRREGEEWGPLTLDSGPSPTRRTGGPETWTTKERPYDGAGRPRGLWSVDRPTTIIVKDTFRKGLEGGSLDLPD